MQIHSREDYLEYLRADLFNSNVDRWTIREYFKNDVMRYQRILRKLEYYLNCKPRWWSRPMQMYLRWRRLRLGVRLGITISPNCFGPGLSIAHPGSLVVNDEVKVGRNCRIHSCVNIGLFRDKAPLIGDNVYIGPGAKLFGGIRIGDDVAIGANAVVNKDVPANVTVGGVPARIISRQGSSDLIPALIKTKQKSKRILRPQPKAIHSGFMQIQKLVEIDIHQQDPAEGQAPVQNKCENGSEDRMDLIKTNRNGIYSDDK
jgi:serine O-acetyltransferase